MMNSEVKTMRDIKLILCDLDGTLLNNESMVTDYTKKAIQKARDQGILFGLATGRSLYAVNQLIDKWGIRDLCDVLLGFNGGQIIDEKMGINQLNHPLKGEYCLEIINHFKDLPCNFVIYDKTTLYCAKMDQFSEKLAKGNHFTACLMGDLETFFKDKSYPKLQLACEASDMPLIIERSKQFQSPNYHCMQTAAILFEYMNPEISKSNGIKTVCDFHGFTMDNVCVFGDAANDRDMLQKAGLGVCMINGDDVTKSISDEITKYTNDEDGVAKYIEEFIIS